MFSSIEDRLAMIWDTARLSSGVAVRDVPLDEMTLSELKVTLVMLRMAYEMAVEALEDEEAESAILDQYDRLFWEVCAEDNDLYGAVLSGRHHPLGGYTDGNAAKYRAIANDSRAR